jgi:hypothetical protein
VVLYCRTFKDSLHERLGQLGCRGFSNILAPCTQDQIVDIICMLGELQRHPFLQVRHIFIKAYLVGKCRTLFSPYLRVHVLLH